jgi:hypothetical protein
MSRRTKDTLTTVIVGSVVVCVLWSLLTGSWVQWLALVAALIVVTGMAETMR